MDPAEVELWTETFTQLMAEKKPCDVWVLHPQESLVEGQLDSGGLLYQLKGLSRLQCRRCSWTWGSAHVHILFHLWWDGDRGQGLVKMQMWGQQCKLCPLDTPLGTLGNCRVIPGDIWAYLSPLVLHILQKCYGDSHGQQCPEIRFGDCCEACDLGVCFLQKVPDSACGAVTGSSCIVECTDAGQDGSMVSLGNNTDANGLQLVAHSGSSVAEDTRDYDSRVMPVTIPLLVVDFMENPFSEGSDFLCGDNCMVSIPFSLVDIADGHGPATQGKGSLPKAGGSRLSVIGQGSICLSGGAAAVPESKYITVNIRAPIFHCPGLLGNLTKTFELKGFLFGHHSSSLSPISVARGQGPIFFNNVPITPGNDQSPVSYNIGLKANGEGAITFPFSLTNIIGGKDSLCDMAEDTRREDGGQSSSTYGYNLLLENHTGGPFTSKEGAVTFPFNFTSDIKDSLTNPNDGKEKEAGQDPAAASYSALLGADVSCPISVSEGAITIPRSVFSIIKRTGPSSMAKSAQCNGFVAYGYYKKRRPKSRSSASDRRLRGQEQSHSRRASRRLRAQAYEDFWTCISITICILWLMCMYRLNLSIAQQQV